MLGKPRVEIIGTPDLPEGVRRLYGDDLLHAHERIMAPRSGGGLALVCYRVQFMRVGLPHVANALVGDDGVTYHEDDVQVLEGEPSTFVSCRTEYCVCDQCLREIRAHAHIIEGESLEDRPLPSIEDAWDRVEGSGLLCGGDHCGNPPQLVVWTREGHRSARRFPSTMDASMTISGVLQWDPGVEPRVTAEGPLTPDEIVDLYEALDERSSGEFLRLDLHPRTCEPIMPRPQVIMTEGTSCPEAGHHVWHGVTFVIVWHADSKEWEITIGDPLPEPGPRW